MLQVREKEVATHKNINIPTNRIQEPDMIFEPDEDFYNSITMEEVREKLYKLIDKLYANESNRNTSNI